MPIKTKPEENNDHVLHRHRPVVTMGLGMALFLAIAVLTMASLTPLRNFSSDNGGVLLRKGDTAFSTPPSTWPIYKHEGQGISFRHPEEWAVTESTFEGNTLITIQDKNSATKKILIYVSPEDFLGFEGLPTTSQKLNGYNVTYVDNSLFGIETSGIYFTFDAGLSRDSLPIFEEITNSIKIE